MKEFLKEKILKTATDHVYDNETLIQLDKISNRVVEKPVIYIGTGTCGLGAGAGDTATAAEKYIKEKNIKADIIKTGCIGLCSSEPLMDVQMPGMNRISFEKVTEEKTEYILDKVFNLELPEDQILGQFMFEDTRAWENVQDINEHPFFKPQKRIVLKNCGIVDPISIEEYIASGGYKSYLNMIKDKTPAEVCDIVEDSGLRGRGGGGFPTGKK